MTDKPSLSHELKRYLTHLQSHVFMAKTAFEQGDTEKAHQYLKEHEKTVQLLSQLIEKEL